MLKILRTLAHLFVLIPGCFLSASSQSAEIRSRLLRSLSFILVPPGENGVRRRLLAPHPPRPPSAKRFSTKLITIEEPKSRETQSGAFDTSTKFSKPLEREDIPPPERPSAAEPPRPLMNPRMTPRPSTP